MTTHARVLAATASAFLVLSGLGAPAASAANVATIAVSVASNITILTPNIIAANVGDTFQVHNVSGANVTVLDAFGTVIRDAQGYACSISGCSVPDTDTLPFTVIGFGVISIQSGGQSAPALFGIGPAAPTEPAPVYSTLTYDANGGACSVSTSGPVEHGKSTPVPTASQCARTQYTLIGFSTSRDGTSGLSFPPGGSPVVTGDNTLFAQWRPVGVEITYDANVSLSDQCLAGGVNVTNRRVTVVVTGALASAAPCTPPTYGLAGWSSTADGSTGDWPLGSESTKVGNQGDRITLYARWAPWPRLTSVCMSGQSYTTAVLTPGAKITLPVTCGTPPRPVARWTTEQNGSGTSYAAGSEVDLSGGAPTLLIYSQAPPSLKATWHAEGGTGACAAGSGGTKATTQIARGANLTAPACAKTGFALVAWTSDGLATSPNLVGSVVESDVVAHAVWRAIPNLGAFWSPKCPPTITPAVWNPATSVFEGRLPDDSACPNAPYTVRSWNTAADGSGTDVMPGAKVTMGASAWYYPQWGIPVTFDFNVEGAANSSAICPTQTIIEPFGKPFVLPDTSACQPAGFLLADWASTPTWQVTSTASAPGATVTLWVPKTYYAWWGSPLTVNFHAGPGSCTTTTKAVATYGLYTLPGGPDCTLTGYRLDGWTTTAGASFPLFDGGAQVIALAPVGDTIDLYARWVEVSNRCAEAPGPWVDWHGCDKRTVNLDNLNMKGANLENTRLDGVSMKNVNFESHTLGSGFATIQVGAQASGAQMPFATLDGANFGPGSFLLGANLAYAHMDNVTFMGASLSDANLSHTTLTDSSLVFVTFYDAKLSYLNATGTEFAFAFMDRADAAHAVFDSATIHGGTWVDANFFRANFKGAALTSLTLRGSALKQANMSGAKLYDVNLTGADLSGANLSGVTFSSTVEVYKNQGVSLGPRGAEWRMHLSDANFTGVNFTNAHLANMDFAGADLTDANFMGADLTGSNLKGATLEGADFTGATMVGVTR